MFSFISVFLITVSLLNCPLSPDYVSIKLHWRTGLREKVTSFTRSNGLLHLLISWIFQWMYPVYVHRRQNNFNRYPPYNISLKFLFFLPTTLVWLIETLCMAISRLVQELHCIINNHRWNWYQLHGPYNTSSLNPVCMKKYSENNDKIFIK